MSADVGSTPSLTRRGRPSSSLRSSSPSGRTSTAWRARSVTAGGDGSLGRSVGRSSAAAPTLRARPLPDRLTDLSAEPIPFQAPRVRPRVKKLRLLIVLVPLVLLAIVSTVFGMMMAVAADVNDLDLAKTFRLAKNSTITDVRGQPLGILTSDQNRVIVPLNQIALVMQNAVIAIEDKRFYTNEGVDVKGIGRAFVADIASGKPVQGASTITQQFVKNRLQAQDKRTIFQKLREAALAYHLSHRWSKPKILREYLNSIYFGNGAYGIESAAETYFGTAHVGCGGTNVRKRPCAAELRPYEAAMLAGIIASPSAYDPVAHPRAAVSRRNLVLKAMLDQRKITYGEYRDGLEEAPPTRNDIRPPH